MIEKNTGITHEKAVVACLLANTEAITNVIGFLKADMFSSRELGFIYKAIVHLFEQGKRTNYNLIDRTMQEASCIGNNIFVFWCTIPHFDTPPDRWICSQRLLLG